MDFDGHYRRLGTIDVSTLQERLALETEASWRADSPRRRPAGGIQRDVSTIALMFGSAEAPRRLPRYADLIGVVRPVLDEVAACITTLDPHGDGSGTIVRCLFARLDAGGVIPPHHDEGELLSRCHRIHIPIFTNEETVFSIEGDERHLGVGEIWEVNNLRRHWVENRGLTPRAHLLIDWERPMTWAGRQPTPQQPIIHEGGLA